MELSNSSGMDSLSYERGSAILPLLLPLFLSCVFTLFYHTSSRLDFKQNRIRLPLHYLSWSSQVPHVHHLIPYIGHVLHLQGQSAAYVNALIHGQPYAHFTINILSYKIHILSPSLDKTLSRHVDDTGLAQVISIVGPSIFGLSTKTAGFIAGNNPRLQHRAEFQHGDKAQDLSKISTRYAFESIRHTPQRVEVDLGGWMFTNTLRAIAVAVWGPENPWCEDGEFVEKFMQFAECFDGLGRPANWLTAPRAYKLRSFLFARLKAHHDAHPEAAQASAQHRINAVAMSDAEWDSNPDYLGVEMISALGFLVTPSTLTVWTLRHLLARPDVLQRVTMQVRGLPEVEQGRVDLSGVNTAAPWLVASWYESLRLHMTGVPRLALHDFEMETSPSGPATSFRKGDIILMPMYTHNRDASVFGPEADEFRPERLLDNHGQLNRSMLRKIKCFGIGGNLCPGRHLGQEVGLATLAETLKTYDMESVDGRGFETPKAANGIALGFQRYEGKIRARLTRRVKVESH